MPVIGVICEYNPFHNGHMHQFLQIRERFGENAVIVCLMSGNYVQRGAPAIFDKSIRAKAAVLCGADLVLELPVTSCLSSAEGFAQGGVQILNQICDVLSFGTETMTKDALFETASALNSDDFSVALKEALSTGCSFPAARQKALERISGNAVAPVNPNDILGIEYCRAIMSSNAQLDVFPVSRSGNYHDSAIDIQAPSATAIRTAIRKATSWAEAVPHQTVELFSAAGIHTMENAEKAILYRLRTMQEEDFAALPFGSEGLWRRFMHACQEAAGLEDIILKTKTKRYTRSRIDRMIMCAFLGITDNDLHTAAPYVRVLAFTDRGRMLLRQKSEVLSLVNTGEKVNHPYWMMENRIENLYGLFAASPDAPDIERHRRVFYHREDLV